MRRRVSLAVVVFAVLGALLPVGAQDNQDPPPPCGSYGCGGGGGSCPYCSQESCGCSPPPFGCSLSYTCSCSSIYCSRTCSYNCG